MRKNIWKVFDNESNKAYFVILQDFIENRPTNEFVELMIKFNEKLTEYSLDKNLNYSESFFSDFRNI